MLVQLWFENSTPQMNYLKKFQIPVKSLILHETFALIIEPRIVLYYLLMYLDIQTFDSFFIRQMVNLSKTYFGKIIFKVWPLYLLLNATEFMVCSCQKLDHRPKFRLANSQWVPRMHVFQWQWECIFLVVSVLADGSFVFKDVEASICWILSLILVLNRNLFPLQDSNMSHLDLDLDLRLKGLNNDLDSVGQSEEDQVKKASSGGLGRVVDPRNWSQWVMC